MRWADPLNYSLSILSEFDWRTMSRMTGTSWMFPLLGLLGSATATTFNVTHYPPANTSNTVLSEVIDGSGAPGIYNSSTTPAGEYGIYNWCAMPHVRKEEYQKVSSDYTLKYLEVIQRHNKRTPYSSNTFFKEDISWDCEGEGPYAYARNANQFNTTPIYWQAEVNTLNPFEYTVGPGFINSTCQFPMETSAGLEDSRVHGEDFRGVYGDMLQFLPLSSEREKYQWRVTNNPITSQTLAGYAAGIYPDIDDYYALIQSDAYDSLEPAFSCPAASAIKAAQLASDPWIAHLNESQTLREKMNNISGIAANDTAGWHNSWDHYYDNLSAKQCHQKALPCSLNDTSLCASQEDANAIYRLGNWEYSYWWRGDTNSTLRSVLTMGPWYRELQGHFADVVSGKSCMKYYHNFAHDGSMAPALGILQIDEPVWPGMASELVFELYEKASNYFLRILWGGQPLKTSTPMGTLDMISLDDFNSYLDNMFPEDFVAACNA
ncbi:histidine phosphatase superfamily [Kockovaella imperatae]|uniref:Histidine phosphatase superfamily n=1 Tax=Kockovaella imperatae TaxID=4999 RepID=A0A1Y1UIR0_9TREE|nr:histidine phosphatase superfamily [Kockovaella imperatae]ORX37384.1 histidine phosphatase superfamily [Kockovaella imperatae]